MKTGITVTNEMRKETTRMVESLEFSFERNAVTKYTASRTGKSMDRALSIFTTIGSQK
jgi:hypothetical protein